MVGINTSPPYAAFGNLLTLRRVEAGFAKQQELATAMGVKQQSVSRWEKGLGRPRASEMPKLEKLVGAKPDELLIAAGFATTPSDKTGSAEVATSFDRALPLAALAPETFESFCTALLSRLYRTAHGDVYRYGGTGSKQHGIDIVAKGPFGTHTFQCKRVNEFGAQKVHTAVAEQTFKADLKVLLLSCVASPKARDAIAAHSDWQLWDREDITRKLHELPYVDRLDLVDQYFSGQRLDLLGISEASPFQSPDDFFKPFLVPERLFNHSWALVGRETELATLIQHVSNESVIVTCLLGAPGGGKSRLLREVVSNCLISHRKLVVRFVSPTEEVKAHHLDELRSAKGEVKLIVVDDAHERDDLGILLRYAAVPENKTRLLLSLRPYGKESLRHQAANVSLLQPEVQFVELSQPTPETAQALASSVLQQCNKPVEAAAGIASATYPTPLVTVLAAQLVSRDEIPVVLLNNETDLRDYVLSRLQDVITATLVTGQDAEKLKAILRVVALVQPIIPDDPALLTALSSLEHIEKADASRLMRLLNEAGVLFKRGLRSRLAPDLLADEILRTNYIESGGSINERAVQFFEQANAHLLKNMFVNLGRLDWRIREGNTDESKLLDSLLPHLRWGDKYHNPHVEAVEAVAYFQPRFALTFATRLIKEGHGESQAVCNIARNAAFTYNHLEEACYLLWLAGRKDGRPLHQNPGHGIRLLKEMAAFQMNKPLAYVEGVVNFALSLLEKPSSVDGAYSPISILEGALETEMESRSFVGNSYTINRYQLPLEQARDIRQSISNALLRYVATEPVRRGFLAAKALSNALRSPMHRNTSDGAWNQEHMGLLRKIRELLTRTAVHPVVLIGLAESVSWHAFFGGPDTSVEAGAVLEHLERDLPTKTIRLLIDGWGHQTWKRSEKLERDTLETYRRQVTGELITAFPDPRKLLSSLESYLQDIADIAGPAHGSPFMFMNYLLAEAPGLAQALLMRGIEENLSERLTPYVGQALSVAIAADDAALLKRYITRSESSDEALRQVAEAYARFSPSRAYSAEEIALFRRIFESTNPHILLTASHLIHQVSDQNASLALELVCTMQFDICAPATHDIFMWLASTRKLNPVELDARRSDLLGKLKSLDRLNDYWLEAFLKKSMECNPTAVLELVKARLQASKEGERWAYVPLDMVQSNQGLGMQSTSLGVRLLREFLDWALVECTEPSVGWLFGKAVSGLWGAYDQSLLDELLAWMSGGSEEHAGLVATVLQNSQSTIIYEYPDFVSNILEAADLISQEAVASIRHSFASATHSGVRSTIPGEPFPEDLKIEEHCKAMLTTLSRTEPAYDLYSDLLRGAREGIARQRRMKEAMEDDDR